MRMRHTVNGGMSGSNILFHIIITQKARFSGEKVIEQKMCFDFLYRFKKGKAVP